MKDWNQIRNAWRKKAEQWATKRNPSKCSCAPGDFQSGEPCKWCCDVMKYMRAMEEHADVVRLP